MTIKEYVEFTKLKLKSCIDSINSDNKPTLLIVKSSDDPASETYIKGKVKDASEVGITATVLDLTQYDMDYSGMTYAEKWRYNRDIILQAHHTDKGQGNRYDGVIVQLPIGEKYKDICDEIIDWIHPEQDVDGFKPNTKFKACTPLGIIDYLKEIHFDFKGKNAVVIGRSNIVGKPAARMLTDLDMNVTLLHSKTTEEDKQRYIANADLIIVATGHIGTLKKEYIYKPTCIVVDVGINRDSNGKLIGDAEHNLPVAMQTPVPGGVGLLTRITLMKNVVLAWVYACMDKVKATGYKFEDIEAAFRIKDKLE